MNEATNSAVEVVKQTVYLKDANIIGYLAVFGAINIPIWLIWIGYKLGNRSHKVREIGKK